MGMPNLDPYPYPDNTPTCDPGRLPLPLQFPSVNDDHRHVEQTHDGHRARRQSNIVRTRISGTVRSKQNASATFRKGNADAMDRGRTGLGFSSCAVPLIWNAPLFQRAEDGVDSEERSSAEGQSRLHLSRAGEERNDKTRVDSSRYSN